MLNADTTTTTTEHQLEVELCGQCGQVLTPEAKAYLLDLVLNDDPADDQDEEDDDLDADDDEDAYILGERRIEYVEPTWRHLSSDPTDAELSKCALCARFFVQAVPIRLFQDLGERVVLGLEVCEHCAPVVLARMRAERR